MPCYFPLHGYKSRTVNPSGKRNIVFNEKDGYRDLPVTVPCGNCLGCRLERSRQWSIRLMHEASLHDLSIFVTLTYEDENLPEGNSLVKAHYQNFMKRLRKFHGKQIRFFHCGEYGETTDRPHYHAILYGLDFADKQRYKTNDQGDQLYTSETLDKIWSHGKCWIGSVTEQSCAYVARYIMKKVTGDQAKEHYKFVNLNTGEIYDRLPEYITMSNRPGIGLEWLDKFSSDVFPSDEVVTRGKVSLPPRYYLKKYAEGTPEGAKAIVTRRTRRAKKHSADSTPDRLRTRLICRQAKISQLKRDTI